MVLDEDEEVVEAEAFDYETEEEATLPSHHNNAHVQHNGSAHGHGKSKMTPMAEVDVDYSLIGGAEDPSIKRVVIECEILSYAVDREGPGLMSRIGGMLGCEENNTIHLDEILNGVKATFYPGCGAVFSFSSSYLFFFFFFSFFL